MKWEHLLSYLSFLSYLILFTLTIFIYLYINNGDYINNNPTPNYNINVIQGIKTISFKFLTNTNTVTVDSNTTYLLIHDK